MTDPDTPSPRRRLGWGGTIALIGAAIGVIFYALAPGTAVVTYDDTPPPAVAEDGGAVVVSLRDSGGFAVFGLQISQPAHHVEVQFTTDAGCTPLLTSEDPWPPPHPECVGPPGLSGTVGGLGITQTGRSLVGVQFTVSGACIDRLAIGTPWPTGFPECDLPTG